MLVTSLPAAGSSKTGVTTFVGLGGGVSVIVIAGEGGKGVDVGGGSVSAVGAGVSKNMMVIVGVSFSPGLGAVVGARLGSRGAKVVATVAFRVAVSVGAALSSFF